MKIKILTGLLSFCLIVPYSGLFAQDDEAFIELDLQLVSSYVWRGENYSDYKAYQKGEVPSSTILSPTFQPSITFFMDNKTYFSIWASYALESRDDSPDYGDYGLKRNDEVDYILGHFVENPRLGNLEVGIEHFTFVYHKNEETTSNNDELVHGSRSASETEIFFIYSLPGEFLSNFFFGAHFSNQWNTRLL